ncbi:unnamed protein product [Polarella glacialis]|uniref:Uncharacterized protein n=1 Tax=Polarella glacialis TaxID=89957 RepID=A0A813DWM5_POLGL|nr:unnamed protein product [Polarella glacialis]
MELRTAVEFFRLSVSDAEFIFAPGNVEDANDIFVTFADGVRSSCRPLALASTSAWEQDVARVAADFASAQSADEARLRPPWRQQRHPPTGVLPAAPKAQAQSRAKAAGAITMDARQSQTDRMASQMNILLETISSPKASPPAKKNVTTGGVHFGEADGVIPSIRQDAPAAGISEAHFAALSKSLQKPVALRDQSGSGSKVHTSAGPADVSDDEVNEGAGEDGGDALSVLSTFTRIMENIARTSSRSSTSEDPLERALEGAGGSSRDSDSTSGGLGIRRGAAARRLLKAVIAGKPFHFTAHVRAAMEDSMNFEGPTVRSRDYLTTRSELGDHRPTVCHAWILGGIWEALERGCPEEAQARVSLGLIACEQVAVDRGNWILAVPRLWEEPPPFSTIARQTRAPNPGQLPASRQTPDG